MFSSLMSTLFYNFFYNSTFNTISYVLGNISKEESLILEKVYKRVIESLEQLNTKKEEYIINALNSFDKEKI